MAMGRREWKADVGKSTSPSSMAGPTGILGIQMQPENDQQGCKAMVQQVQAEPGPAKRSHHYVDW